jgi:prepilin-type processing-associated H-X9-DG protein
MMPIAMLSPSRQAAFFPPLRVARLGTASLERLSRGPLKPGRIHSVFERAVNVLWGDGHLLTLHGPGLLAAPFAIALDRVPARSAVAPGMTIERSNFEWASAERVALEMPAGALGFGPDALPETGCARALGSGAGLRARDALERGIVVRDASAFADAACSLIGLGEGLTPAGDDCVVGALAALYRLTPGWLSAHDGQRDRLADAARRRTTDVAREFVLEALDGRFAEPVLALLTAGSDGDAGGAARRLLAMGATSGADTLCGIRLALRALERLKS